VFLFIGVHKPRGLI